MAERCNDMQCRMRGQVTDRRHLPDVNQSHVIMNIA